MHKFMKFPKKFPKKSFVISLANNDPLIRFHHPTQKYLKYIKVEQLWLETVDLCIIARFFLT